MRYELPNISPVQVLVEKLLRSTSVSKIYLLIRPKKGVATQLRLKALLDSKIFDRVREDNSDVLLKVVAVSGDITEKKLGLSEEEERLVIMIMMRPVYMT